MKTINFGTESLEAHEMENTQGGFFAALLVGVAVTLLFSCIDDPDSFREGFAGGMGG